MNKKYIVGVSLLEVLISLTIISGTLFAYLDLQARSLQWLHASHQQYQQQLQQQNDQQ